MTWDQAKEEAAKLNKDGMKTAITADLDKKGNVVWRVELLGRKK